jgi:phage-related protein
VGVRFTAEQEQMVKSLVAQGKTVEAQKIILQELQTEFGGSAEAAGKTFAGQLDILRNKLLALAGDVGAKFLPQLEAFVTIVGPKIEAFAQNLAALLSDPAITQGISLLAAELNKLMNGNFGTLTDLIPPSVLDGFKNLAAAIQEKMPVIQGAMQFFVSWLQEAWARVGPTLIANISTALNTLAELWRKHGDTIIAALTIAFQIIGATVGGALVLLSGIITSFLQLLNGDWESAGQTLTATTDSFMNMVLSIIGTNLEEVRATWQANTEMAMLIVQTFFADLVATWQANIEMVTLIVRTFFANLVATWQANWDMVVLIIKTIWDNIQKAIAAKIIEIILNIKKFIADVLATIEGYKQAFIDMGGNMMNWMTQGIRAAAEGLMNAIRDASGRAINSVRELLPMGTTTQLQIENVQDAIIAPGGRIISTAPDDFLIATKTPGRLLGGAGAGGVTVNLYYAPAVSFGDRYEAEQTLVPILREALRQL